MSDTEADALLYIANSLTASQRRALVVSLVNYGAGDQVLLVGGGEHTARALQRGPAPLAYQEGMERFLTPLGRAVARHLNQSGAWEVAWTLEVA